jgi:hypothetical protein
MLSGKVLRQVIGAFDIAGNPDVGASGTRRASGCLNRGSLTPRISGVGSLSMGIMPSKYDVTSSIFDGPRLSGKGNCRYVCGMLGDSFWHDPC